MTTGKQIDFVKIMVVLLLFGILTTSVVMIFRLKQDDMIPITLFVFLSAILGSAVNESSKQRKELVDISKLDKTVFLSWKLLVAIVFSLFLYIGFQSLLIRGPLFPQFQQVEGEPYTNMMDFMEKCKPKTNLDAAKMFVWAFIAGYAERFVPNLIQDLGKKPETDA